MTCTKQPLCETIADSKNYTENPAIPEKSDPKKILLDSLVRLYAEIDDFQKVAEKYFKNMKQKSEKQELS